MKKLLFVAALGVAGFMSAKNISSTDPQLKKVKRDANKNGQNQVLKTDKKTSPCYWVESSCGEGGVKCTDNYEALVEFQYLLEDSFCGGCYIGC